VSDEHDGVSAGTSGDDPSGDGAKAASDKPVAGAARRAAAGSKPEPGSESTTSLSKSAPDSVETSPSDGPDANGTETDGADAESIEADGADSALTTPASPGSARAAARRAAARAGTSEKKGEATPKRGSTTAVKKPNPFARLGRFLREVVAELRKVIWPSRNQMVTYTIVVIAFVTFMVALVGVLDLLFAKGVFAVFG
jgi:preprotein translocase subunit SecE